MSPWARRSWLSRQAKMMRWGADLMSTVPMCLYALGLVAPFPDVLVTLARSTQVVTVLADILQKV
jgi:hypothetical protein